jgi:hypothetical protein
MNADEDELVAMFRKLSPFDQRRVLEFVRAMKPQIPPDQRKPVGGMYEHLGLRISKEEIDEARREAWVDFPRAFPEGETP